MKSSVVAIVPSAGLGKRLGLKVKKPFLVLDGKPLIIHTLNALERSEVIDAIILAVEKECIGSFTALIKKYRLCKVTDIIAGGRTRRQSVGNCIKHIRPCFDIVLVHDGARPFIGEELIKGTVIAARKFGASIAAVPESDTVKLTGKSSFIRKTLDRKFLYRAQTPQVFRYDILKKAYSYKGKAGVTDDASLVEKLDRKIKIVPGSYDNIKITTKSDLDFANYVLKVRKI